MKIAAAVILYNPPRSAVDNIITYYSYFDIIFVFDNSEKESLIKEDLLQLSKIKYKNDYKNEGISKRLNEAAEMSIENGVDWLLTMDQDSSFRDGSLSGYLDCFYGYINKKSAAAFGPAYNREINLNSRECKTEEVEYLITSGMLLNLEVFEKIGRFDEALFIDSVDHDYCIRARLKGYSIVQFSNIFILHELGKVVYKSSIKSLYLIRKKKVVHPPLRCYYMYRNLLYLEKKYKELDFRFPKQLKQFIISRINNSGFYGGSLFTFLKYLRAAKEDFKNNRMGKRG